MDSFKNNDPFKQLIKGKLADYKEEVSPFGWKKLESSLFAAQKSKTLHTRWLVSSLSAVAAVFIGVLFLFQNTNKELPVTNLQQPTTQTIENKKTFIQKQNTTKVEKPTTSLFADNTSLSKQRQVPSSIIIEESFNNSTPESSVSNRDSEIISVYDDKLKNKTKASEVDEKTKQQLIQDFINEGNRSFDVGDNTQRVKSKSRHSISLSGKSGLSSSQQTNSLPTALRASVSESYSKYTISKMEANNEEVEVNPESETNHMQPISFGVLTSFDLTRKLQIETGLVYSYLSSETKSKSSDFNNSEKVQFHFLGIPLNINYTLLSVNKLDLFVTGGAMIEKDISGKIKYSDEKESSLLKSGYANESSSKIKQKNPQFSVAGGLGITYPIYDKAKLFGKIGGRYYIDANNEYKTYFSDEKFGLDIQLGIKFNF